MAPQPLEALLDRRCLLLLGEPGMGKSTTLRHEEGALLRHCQATGAELVLPTDLRMFQSESFFVERIFGSDTVRRWKEGNGELYLVLDGFDECPLSESLDLLLVEELRKLPYHRLHLLLASRPAAWDESFEAALKELWGEAEVQAFELAPLSRDDIRAAAEMQGVDPEAFLQDVQECEALSLASRPITLRMLLDEVEDHRALPADRWQLYLDGCRRLVRENNPARARGNALSVDARLCIASWIAVNTELTDRRAIWTGAPEGDERRNLTVDALAGENFAPKDVREVLDSGLFGAAGEPGLVRWAHASYSEFLAAHELIHRKAPMELLETLILGRGSAPRVYPPLQGVAVWLSGKHREFRERLLQVDPGLVLWSDALRTDVELRRTLVDHLIRRADVWPRGSRIGLGFPFERLNHPGLKEQLRAALKDREVRGRGQRIAVMLVSILKERALVPDCVDLVVNRSAERVARDMALAFVMSFGTDGDRRSLADWALSVGARQSPDLQEHALARLWPDVIATSQLLEAGVGGGAAQAVRARLPTEELVDALRWVESRPTRELLAPDGPRQMQDAVLVRAWKDHATPGVFDAFADAVAARLARTERAPGKVRKFLPTDAGFPVDWNEHGTELRYRLIESLVARMPADRVASIGLAQPPLLTDQDDASLVARIGEASSPEERSRWEDARGALHGLSREECLAFIQRVEADLALASFFSAGLIVLGSRATALYGELTPVPSNWGLILDLPAKGHELARRAATSSEHWPAFVEMLRQGDGGSPRYVKMVAVITEDRRLLQVNTDSLIQTARRFLEERPPPAEPWLSGAPIDLGSASGYDALLLLATDPAALAALPDQVWRRWTSLLLATIPANPSGRELRQELIHMACEKAPEQVRETFRRILSSRHGLVRICAFLDALEGAWTPLLCACAAEALQTADIHPVLVTRLRNAAGISQQAREAHVLEGLPPRLSHRHEAEPEHRWQPLTPEQIRALLLDPRKRVVRNADDLLEAVVESIGRYERALRGYGSELEALWNQTKGSSTPKDEANLSNALLRHLQRELVVHKVIVNREVEIQARQPTRSGQRTDLQIDAVVEGPSGQERASVIIEVKKCSSADLWTAMQGQLAERYLGESQFRHGLYVVGWFAGPALAPGHPTPDRGRADAPARA